MIYMNRDLLKKHLYLLLDICPKHENRLYRAPAGILLDTAKKDGIAILAATDGHRMLHCEIPCYIDGKARYIIPKEDVKTIYKQLGSKIHPGEHIGITYISSSLTLKFRIGEHYYTTRLLDGEFPSYERRITSDYGAQCELTEPIGLNPKHLAHLGKWKTEVVAVKIATTKRPVYFVSDDYPGMMYVVMPIDIGEV
jgi:DNA polymerase III sliding clamp (beta) subunit (PCNA family)